MKKYIVIIISLVFIEAIFGQQPIKTIISPTDRFTSSPNASRYTFSPGSDALLMTVKIWGEVQKPGLYDVPIGTDLIELLSVAGGPTTLAKLSKIKIIRTAIDSNDVEGGVIIVDVKNFLKSGDEKLIPEIKPDDTIVIPVKPTQYLLTSLSWTQQFLSLFSIYSMIIYYTSH